MDSDAGDLVSYQSITPIAVEGRADMYAQKDTILLTEQRYDDDKLCCPFDDVLCVIVRHLKLRMGIPCLPDFHVVKAVARGKLVSLRRETWWEHADSGQTEILRPTSPPLCPTFANMIEL